MTSFIIEKPYSQSLSYDDIFIIPQYSDISSRKEVDVSVNITDLNLSNKPAGTTNIKVPIVNANMDTVAGEDIAVAIANAGGLATLHRFQSIEDACAEYTRVVNRLTVQTPVFVSVGVNRDSIQRAQTLYNHGARHMIIDIAHGHSEQMKKMIEWIKGHLPGTYVMAGNVATRQGVIDLTLWGADAVKVNVGPGAVCVTKNVTGVTVPTVTSLIEAFEAKLELQEKYGREVALVADGGAKEIGDICKAIGIGIDFVMTGKLFAGSSEAPGKGVYRGSASKDVQTLYRTDKEYVPTPEGKSINVELTDESASDIVEHVAGGLRSAYSYVGARTTQDFKDKVTFGVRYNKS